MSFGKESFRILILLLVCIQGYSQQVQTIKTGVTKLPKVKWKESFTQLEKSIDTASLVFVGTFKVAGTIGKPGIMDHFYLIQEKSKRLGANAYILDYHHSDTASNTSTTILSTYFANDKVKIKNESLKPKGFIYVFGDDRIYLKNKTTAFEFNDREKEIHNTAEYFVYHIKPGEYITIKKGGVTGSVVEIEGQKDSPSFYFSVSGANVAIRPVSGASITGGQIQPVDKDLSEFLIKVLRPVR